MDGLSDGAREQKYDGEITKYGGGTEENGMNYKLEREKPWASQFREIIVIGWAAAQMIWKKDTFDWVVNSLLRMFQFLFDKIIIISIV